MNDEQKEAMMSPWEPNHEFVCLEGLKHHNRFFTTNNSLGIMGQEPQDPRYSAKGELWYRILGYAETVEEAQLLLYGRSSTTKPEFGLIFETPTMKVERFPEAVHISLSLGSNGGYLVCGISRKDAIKLGDILLDDPQRLAVMKG